MQLSKVREGDEVECNVNGRVFAAIAGTSENRRLNITPVNSRLTYTQVKAQQVAKILRKKNERVTGRPEER